MAGSNSSPCAGLQSSRPSLRVITNFSTPPTAVLAPLSPSTPPLTAILGTKPNATGRVFSRDQVSDIWNSHVESLISLINDGPSEARWVGGSPVVTHFGQEMFRNTTHSALRSAMGPEASMVSFSHDGSLDMDALDEYAYVFGGGEDGEDFLDFSMEMDVTPERTSGYTFGMGQDSPITSTFAENYQFGLSTPSEPSTSPMQMDVTPELTSTQSEPSTSPMQMDVTPELTSGYVFGMGQDSPSNSPSPTPELPSGYVFGMGQDSPTPELTSGYVFGMGQDSSRSELTPELTSGYVFGMGQDSHSPTPDLTSGYVFGMGQDSPVPSTSPMPEHIECAMNVDNPTPSHNSAPDSTIQAYVFGQNGMGLDFATLSDQMAEQSRSFIVNMATDGATGPPPPRPNQGSSTQPQPTAITRPSVLSLASTGNQTQVSSSSMPPPPAPLPTGTWIQPHRLPANAPPADPNATYRSQRALANSGVSIVTNYPLSSSPRMTATEIHANLNQRWGKNLPHDPFTLMESGDAVGVHSKDKEVITSHANFMPFSYDSTFQPRTAAARAQGDDDNVSPRTKLNNNRTNTQSERISL